MATTHTIVPRRARTGVTKSSPRQNCIEARRDEILRNGKEAQKAEKNNELVFSDNIETLMQI